MPGKCLGRLVLFHGRFLGLEFCDSLLFHQHKKTPEILLAVQKSSDHQLRNRHLKSHDLTGFVYIQAVVFPPDFCLPSVQYGGIAR